MPTSSAGYSGTPLAKKLGIQPNHRVLRIAAPEGYENLLAPLPPGVRFLSAVQADVNLAHVFVTEKKELARHLKALREQLDPQIALWVSWPKKASKVQTDISEDSIRELALPLGFVDVKVCAVDAVWSGLKLVVRKELRPAPVSATR